MTMRYRADSSLRRFGNVVVGGSPLRLFRMSVGGALALDAIVQGEPLSPVQQQLARRLADAGAVHPDPVPAASPFTVADVTVVVPAFGNAVAHAVTAPWLAGVADVIVVDDASPTPLVALEGQRLVRRAANGGPGAARNTGLAEVGTPLVAFVDSDTIIDASSAADWLQPLLDHFADERVALVAPRVTSTPGGNTLLDRYERHRSPLDLGAEPARVAAGTRVGYVPAAAILCRAEMVRALGGFDETLRFGEDVDLVWRLVDAGRVCRYEPAVVVGHRSRATLGQWLAQRAGYGTSAAPLEARHPGALAPLRISGWSALAWGLVAVRRPLGATAVGVATTVALARKLPDLPRAEVARLGGLGNLYAGRQVATAITRGWWPIAVPIAAAVRRVRWPLAAAVVVPALLDWRASRARRGAEDVNAASLDPVRYVAMHIADDVAYSVGVWRGIRRERSAAALRPALTNWPPRGDG